MLIASLSCDSGSEPDWSKYSSSLKAIINSSNCDELQYHFNIAEANSDNQRARTGTGTANLMSYIDSKMQEKNCY